MNILDRLSKALKGADKAGDTDAAKKLAGEIRRYLAVQQGRKDKVKQLEEEALKKGLSQKHVDYAYETDTLIGAPKGTTLAILRQESRFNPKAQGKDIHGKPSGALGIAQFTQTGVADVLFGRKPVTDEERRQVINEKQSLFGNIDKSLEYQRKLLTTLYSRSKNWEQSVRNYNGDKKINPENGREERDNYVLHIKGMIGQ